LKFCVCNFFQALQDTENFSGHFAMFPDVFVVAGSQGCSAAEHLCARVSSVARDSRTNGRQVLV
jgi:hypothetical protein